MNLGSRLKSALAKRKLTVTEFSRQSGISAQTLYALINRDSNKADIHILQKVLSALDMDFATFMGEESSTPGVVSAAPAVPAGKFAIYIDEKLYAQILELAKDEGITDPDTIAHILEEYLEAGFGYRQRPLRSMLRDAKPHSGRTPGEMDSFLL
jgi:transcriptional regulator with XRE-family HTH domain